MREETIKILKFDELSEDAKKKAREWFRESIRQDDWWSDAVKKDAEQCFALCGFTIDKVYWSGFWSQGDGACFEGSWKASDVKPGALKDHAPKDKELHRIAKGFERLAKKYPLASLSVKHSGHYYHEHCTVFDVSIPYDEEGQEDESDEAQADKDALIELSKDAMRWTYKQLEKAWDYENEDDTVEENIRANEYEFTEDGERWV